MGGVAPQSPQGVCGAWPSVWALALVNQLSSSKRMAVLSWLGKLIKHLFGWSLNCHPALWVHTGADDLHCVATQHLLKIWLRHRIVSIMENASLDSVQLCLYLHPVLLIFLHCPFGLSSAYIEGCHQKQSYGAL